MFSQPRSGVMRTPLEFASSDYLNFVLAFGFLSLDNKRLAVVDRDLADFCR
jgi:hypothetical protein